MMENASNAAFSGDLKKVLKELQGLRLRVVVGAAAATRMDVSGMDDDDTILSVISRDAAGQPTDRTGTVTMNSRKASGTVSVGTAAAGDTAVVEGITYTLRVAVPTSGGREVLIGANADATAANLAAAINLAEQSRSTGPKVKATVATNVVTVTSVVAGTAGNAYTLVETGSSFTVSGANLAGGDANGGFTSSANLSGLAVEVWFFAKQN
jgi:hypothetical protein